MSTLTSTLPAKPDAQEPPLPLAQGDLRTTLRPVAFGLLVAGVGGLFLLELMIGVVPIPLSEILALLVGAEVAQAAWSTILYELRLPRAITALVGGAALGAAGLQLQTLFRNPLAGPWALGITAGAQLGVALVVVAGGVVGSTFLEQFVFLNNLSLVAGAGLGAALVLAAIASVSRRVSTITLLIMGLMLGFLAQGLVSVVLHFTNETQGKVFASWNDGSFAGVHWEHFPILIPMVVVGIVAALLLVKPLNALLLGEQYAATLGLSVGRARLMALGSTVLLAAPITAYCGPVLFIGLIVPHLCRGLFNTSDHRLLMPAVLLMGAALGLSADLFVHLPWERHFLHLNAINALIGAPVVIWVILRNKHMRSLAM
ncbi:MAG: iron ABC transporter permease [Bacteroidota bacterium]